MEEQGPFDRILQAEPPPQRDRAATVIVAVGIVLGLLLLILVLPPISILDNGEKAAYTGPINTTVREELPQVPEGFEAVSPLYDLSSPEPVSQRVRLTIGLSAPVSEGESLHFFSYQDGRWRRLGDASAVGDGGAAQGEVPFLPGNLAVLRPTGQVRFVLGSLAPGAELDPQAPANLSMLNPTGLVPAADGGIAGGPLQLPPDLQMPVAPTISALNPPEIEAVNTVLASGELRANHVQAILQLARESASAGIDIDYREIDPSREGEFVEFVRELSSGLHQDGRSLSLTLPLPERRDKDWDTLGFDWQALAALVDHIKLAPGPDPDQYHERVDEALAFLVPRVGSSKLLLTVGPLSRERSVDGVRTLTLREALSLASTPQAVGEAGDVLPEATLEAVGQNLAERMGASGLRWDDTARAVAFSYAGLGGERTVWVANVFSEAFKLDLARRYRLGGVALDDVSRAAGEANVWPVVQQYAATGEVGLVKPNGELLKPHWTASGGTLESDSGASVTWRAPAEAGNYTLTLIVSDGVVRVGQELPVAVRSAPGAVSP